MKKLSLTVLALVACLGAVSIATAAKPMPSKIGTDLNVSYKGADPNDPYGTSKFKGKVGPKKCAAGRKVKIKGPGKGKKGPGKTKTNSKGKFTLALGSPAAPGRYKVKVAPKTYKQGKKANGKSRGKKGSKGKTETICKRAKTTIRIR